MHLQRLSVLEEDGAARLDMMPTTGTHVSSMISLRSCCCPGRPDLNRSSTTFLSCACIFLADQDIVSKSDTKRASTQMLCQHVLLFKPEEA